MKRVAALCALLCLFFLGGCRSVQGVSTVPTGVPTVATHTAGTSPTTAAPTATATRPLPAGPTGPTVGPTATHAKTVPSPHIGDAIAVWDTYYVVGRTISTTQIKMRQYSDDTGAVPFTIVASYDPMHNNRVFTITVTANGKWGADNMQQHTFPAMFIPTDAGIGGSTLRPNGVEDQYYSSALASRFPSTYFMDNDGKLVRAGLVTIFYRYATTSGATIAHATISLGTLYGL